jgi:hypothetical protein
MPMGKTAFEEVDFVLAAVRCSPQWWQDDRKNWCAYCGIPMRRKAPATGPKPNSVRTRDHVIPLAHKGGFLTIPACRGCNAAKGQLSLQTFLLSDYFNEVRKKRHRNQWPVRDLWLASAAAAIRCAMKLAKKQASPVLKQAPPGIADPSQPAGVKLSATPLIQ